MTSPAAQRAKNIQKTTLGAPQRGITSLLRLSRTPQPDDRAHQAATRPASPANDAQQKFSGNGGDFGNSRDEWSVEGAIAAAAAAPGDSSGDEPSDSGETCLAYPIAPRIHPGGDTSPTAMGFYSDQLWRTRQGTSAAADALWKLIRYIWQPPEPD